jgi:hypothetical protein
VETLGGAGLLAAASGGALRGAPAGRKTNYYLFQQYSLKAGSQVDRLHAYLSEGFLPAANKFDSGPKIVLEAVMAPHFPLVAVFWGVSSLETLQGAQSRLHGDASYQKAVTTWESGSEPPYEEYSQSILKVTDYGADAPALPKPKSPRFYELRTYHAPTSWQLAALHERFSTSEIGIFHRTGIHPVLYTETLYGPNMPNLTYLIPFDSQAAREAAWAAFQADPEWIKVRKASIDKSGQINAVSNISLFRATAYSPIG